MAADTNNEMLPSSLCDNNNRVFIMTLGNVISVNNSQKNITILVSNRATHLVNHEVSHGVSHAVGHNTG